MTYRDWLPSLWRVGKDDGPFGTLRNRLDDILDEYELSLPSGSDEFTIRSNVSETDKEICITTELPGIDEKDVDIEIFGDRITIRGE